ncbi:MAG: NAD(P)H-hydrate epimerase [Eggerthellaceae bacterium]|nr:NAD(P)H-hydrate epimerase [Eggerthellaceae bacterium]
MTVEHIVHSIPPTYDERSRVLVLGSLPSPKSREYGFNYGHSRNRFWQVLAQLADEPIPDTVDRKRDFCLRHHIALWDVVAECDIEGASDASIRNAVPNDLAKIVSYAPIEAVFCTGAKAYELYNKLGCEQACNIPAVKLPSTSPANAKATLEELVAAYACIFEHAHVSAAPVLDVEDVRELERQIAEGGTSLQELMDRAGSAVAWRTEAMLSQIEEGAHPRITTTKNRASRPIVLILCGSGNNGGDGWVAAQLLAERNFNVCIISAKSPDELRAQPARDAALRAQSALAEMGGITIEDGDPLPVGDDGLPNNLPLTLIRPNPQALATLMECAEVVVDAILGIGFTGGSVKEPYCEWIHMANETRGSHAILAVDVPSGLDAQTGASTDAIAADETITMIVSKPGLTSKECGIVRVAGLANIEPYL